MNATLVANARRLRGLMPALLLLLLTACATHKIDWAARVGNYTFDQAVTELGPPDKQARLQDGEVVADWLTRRGYAYSYPPFGCGGPPYWNAGPVYPVYTTAPDYYLRLTFGPEGELKTWKTFAR